MCVCGYVLDNNYEMRCRLQLCLGLKLKIKCLFAFSYLIGPVKQFFFSVKLRLYSYPLVPTFVLGTQKNSFIKTVLLSTHNICFG